MEFKKPKKLSKKANDREQLTAECVARIREGMFDEGRAKLEALLEKHGDRFEVRSFALEAYRQLDMHPEMLREMAIMLALQPDYFAVHYFLAKDAMERGELALAEALLNASWKIRKKGLSKKQAEKAKASHYSVLEPAEAPEDDE